MRHCANELVSLQPQFVIVWEAILCDIFFSAGAEGQLADRLDMCLEGGEFETVTVDTTVKPTYALVGKVGGISKRSTKLNQAVPYAEQLRGIHIVRGSSGSVLLINPMISESISDAGALYRDRFTSRQRNAARYFAADKVGPLLCRTTRDVFHKIRGCALDPLRLAFDAEQSTWGPKKKNSPHWEIRRILSKFPPKINGRACAGGLYQGDVIRAGVAEAKARSGISKSRISKRKATNFLRNLDTKNGFNSRGEFGLRLQNAVAAFPAYAVKWTLEKRPVKRHLFDACSPSGSEWYLNNERIRRDATPQLVNYMARGATGSEALNAELKRWFHGIAHMRPSTMRLEL